MEQYKVELFDCPGTIPFVFARHPWFLVHRRGAISRWEIHWQRDKHAPSWGHLHKNIAPVLQGLERIPFVEKYFSRGVLRGSVEGGEGSVAERMGTFIETSPQTYPYCNTYRLLGPNSNTYAQWVLKQFPESNLRLRWNAFGKNWKA